MDGENNAAILAAALPRAPPQTPSGNCLGRDVGPASTERLIRQSCFSVFFPTEVAADVKHLPAFHDGTMGPSVVCFVYLNS